MKGMKIMPMTEQSIVLGGAASHLRIATSALELAKAYMPPEKSVGFDKIITDSLEVAAKVKQLVKELEDESEE